MRGTQKNWSLFLKKCVFTLTCLNFSQLQSILHLMQYTYWDIFSTSQNSFWTLQFWCLLVLLPFFVSPFPRQQNVSYEDFSHPGEQEKVAWSEMGWIGRVGHRSHAIFGQKLLNTWCGVGRCAGKSPIMKWANMLKESSKKKITEAKHSLSQQLQLVHWYRWVLRTLTYWGKPVLQGPTPRK